MRLVDDVDIPVEDTFNQERQMELAPTTPQIQYEMSEMRGGKSGALRYGTSNDISKSHKPPRRPTDQKAYEKTGAFEYAPELRATSVERSQDLALKQ